MRNIFHISVAAQLLQRAVIEFPQNKSVDNLQRKWLQMIRPYQACHHGVEIPIFLYDHNVSRSGSVPLALDWSRRLICGTQRHCTADRRDTDERYKDRR